jgi:hypothetical protein
MADKQTPTDEHAAAYFRGQTETYRFLRMCPTYIRNNHNNSMLQEEIDARGLSWTAEDLALCYQALLDNCALTDEPDPAPEPAKAEPKVEDAQEVRTKPWPELSAQVIRDMPLEEYRRYYRNHPEFRSEVDALKIPVKGKR